MNLMLINIIIYMLNLITISIVIFIEKKNTNSAFAWILVLLFFPILGFILYFFLGSTRKIKLFNRKYKQESITKIIINEIKKIYKYPNNIDDKIFKLNYNDYLNTVTKYNDIEIFNNMNEACSLMLKDMLNAKESINIEFFIFKAYSAIGEKIINILEKKQKEGVKVKIIYDRLANIKNKKKYFNRLLEQGAEIEKHLPSLLKTLGQANYRNHRKMVVIDGNIAYTGGMNIGDEYLSLDKKITPWRDSWVRIKGESVMFIQAWYLNDFLFLKKMRLKKKYNNENIKKDINGLLKHDKVKNQMKVQMVQNGPDTESSYIKDGYLSLIAKAKKNLLIYTPYFIPDDTIMEALRICVKSGINVSIVIPGIPDKLFVYYVTCAYIEELYNHGINVYIYNGFVHSKMVICDDELISLGTCNFDLRSFCLNYENNLFVQSKKLVKTARKQFEEDKNNSIKVTEQTLKSIKIKDRIISRICKLLSPIL